MQVEYCVAQLAQHGAVLAGLAQGFTGEAAHWKPSEDEWSVVEVVNHLYDEEREDFRFRLRHLLQRETTPWPPIDPDGWVRERRYAERDLAESIANFLREREESLVWLRSLGEQDWSARFAHGGRTSPSAGEMLASWAAHDVLHLRQLVELRYAYGRQAVAPWSVEYAGEW